MQKYEDKEYLMKDSEKIRNIIIKYFNKSNYSSNAWIAGLGVFWCDLCYSNEIPEEDFKQLLAELYVRYQRLNHQKKL